MNLKLKIFSSSRYFVYVVSCHSIFNIVCLLYHWILNISYGNWSKIKYLTLSRQPSSNIQYFNNKKTGKSSKEKNSFAISSMMNTEFFFRSSISHSFFKRKFVFFRAFSKILFALFKWKSQLLRFVSPPSSVLTTFEHWNLKYCCCCFRYTKFVSHQLSN